MVISFTTVVLSLSKDVSKPRAALRQAQGFGFLGYNRVQHSIAQRINPAAFFG
jgi:hypothetical protein